MAQLWHAGPLGRALPQPGAPRENPGQAGPPSSASPTPRGGNDALSCSPGHPGDSQVRVVMQ